MSTFDFVKRLLPKNRFARSVSVVASGTVASQLLIVLASPILTRLYGPDDFGVLAVYTSLLLILSEITSLRYQVAIPLPDDDRDAAVVAVLSIIVVAGITITLTPVILYFRGQIAAALNTPALSAYLWLLPLGLLLAGFYQVCNYWAIRTKAFREIARTKLTQALCTLGIQIGGFGLGPISLLLGQVGGQTSGAVSLGTLAIKSRLPLFKTVRFSAIVQAACRYKRFPLFSTWGRLFNIIGRQLPALLFAILFGPAIAGMYALSHRVLSLPSRLVGQAIGDVFLSSASASLRRDNLGLLVAKVHERLAHIAMAPTLVLVLAGPELFALVFGSNWELAGKFAQWLAPFLYMTFVTSPLTRVFSVLEKQVHEVAFQGALLVIRFSGLLIGAWIGEPLIAVALFAIGSAFCYMLFLWWIVVVAGIPWAKFRHAMLTAFGWSIMLTSPLILVKLIGLDTMFLFIALAVTGVAIVARDLAMVLESNQSQA